jgi:quinol-cytochrome oxidoreductase complex cytochrome b subunit
MFFILVYIHIARGLYYGSYRAPRATLWIVGVVIYICMMAELSWPNWYFKIDFNVNQESKIIQDLMNSFGIIPVLFFFFILFSRPKILAMKRIGPHNHNIFAC